MYKAREVCPWSLWQGNQFLFKYEGDDIEEGAAALGKIFAAMCESTNALYTLKIYEELPKNGKINRTTPDHGSFNFRLQLETQIFNHQEAQSIASKVAMQEEIKQLREELREVRAELDEVDDEPGPDIWERINGILEKPAVVGALNKILGTSLTPRPPATVSGVGDAADLEGAILILREHDPRLDEHLWKLAHMAQEKPNNFKFLLSTLDSLQ
jgi:hypothetical protein